MGRNQREIAIPQLIINVTSDLERNLISKHYVNDGTIYELCFIDRKIEAQSTLQVGSTHSSEASILLVPRSLLRFKLYIWTSPCVYQYLLSQMCFSYASKISACILKVSTYNIKCDKISPPLPHSPKSKKSKTGAGLIFFEVIKHK